MYHQIIIKQNLLQGNIINLRSSKVSQITPSYGTEKDKTLQKLTQYTLQGWTKKISDMESCVKPYYTYREEIVHHEGLLFKGQRVIVPTKLRSDIKSRIHQGHMGIEKCTQRARQSVFWPFINSDIKDMVSSCTTCLTHRNRQQQETLIPHKIPSHP